MGERIRESDQQLRNGRGYDHTYCLGRNGELALAARLEAPRSGRIMELFTDQPGLQVYSGNYLDGTISGKIAKELLPALIETGRSPDALIAERG